MTATIGKSVRCVQCQWTIRPHQLEDVHKDGLPVPLHRGGCPSAFDKEVERDT